MSNKLNNMKVSLGLEVSPGTAVARDCVVPFNDMPTLGMTVEKSPDDAIVGNGMDTGAEVMAYKIGGGLNLSMRPVKAVDRLLQSLLGQRTAAVQIGAVIKVLYTGAEEACRLTASGAGDTLTAEIGDYGSVAVDNNFGVAGVLDLTGGTVDTVAELVGVINGYADYSAEKVMGADDVDTAEILDIITNAAGHYAYIFFGSATSGAYLYKYTPDLGATERPTLTAQVDGLQGNYLYPGTVVESMSFAGELKARMKSAIAMLGLGEEDAGAAYGGTLEDVSAMSYGNGVSLINGVKYNYIKSFEITPKNNHDEEGGFGQGSLYPQENIKGKFGIEGTVTIRLDANSGALRPKVANNDLVSVQLEAHGSVIAEEVKEWLLYDMPFCGLMEKGYNNANGTIDVNFKLNVFNKRGTNYDDPFTVFMIAGSGAY